MNTELPIALMTEYNASAGDVLRGLLLQTSAAVPKMFEDEAPQKTKFPYTTFSMIASGNSYTMSADMPSPRVQWSVWDDQRSSKRAKGIADAIVDLYNTKTLAMINGWLMIQADPVTPGRKLRNTTDKGFQVIVEFDFLLEKTRT